MHFLSTLFRFRIATKSSFQLIFFSRFHLKNEIFVIATLLKNYDISVALTFPRKFALDFQKRLQRQLPLESSNPVVNINSD